MPDFFHVAGNNVVHWFDLDREVPDLFTKKMREYIAHYQGIWIITKSGNPEKLSQYLSKRCIH